MYLLEIDERQARILNDALDLYSRIGIGQLEEIANNFRWFNDPRLKDNWDKLDIARSLLDSIKMLLFKQPPNGSYGIYHPDVPDCYRVAWDIQKVIRHHLWLERQAQGEGQRFCVDADEPNQSAKDQPLAKISTKEESNGS